MLKYRNIFYLLWYFVSILLTWWECWQKLHRNPKVKADIEQWAVCVTLFLCVFSRCSSFLPQSKHKLAKWETQLLVVVSVSGRWVCTGMTAMSDLFLFLYLRPKMRFDFRLYSICILSRLLTSLKDAHRNKLLIDLLCSLSRQLTIASQVFYFLSFFLFFFAHHQSAV